MNPAYEITGRLLDARSVTLDEPVPLIRGRVRVTVQSMETAERKPGRDALTDVHVILATAGHVPPTADDVTLRVAEERAAWE